MSKADARRNKQQRRAREDIERGLKRRSAALALEGWLALPAEATRDPALGAARSWLAAELRAALEARDAAATAPWLKALCKAPALLGQLGIDDAETRWALLWEAGPLREWKAAELLLSELEPALVEGAPALGAAVTAYVRSRGQLAPEHLVGLERIVSLDDEKDLEAARPRSKRSATPPPEQAAAELVDCYATDSWETFATTATRWLRALSPGAVQAELALTVMELGTLEVLARTAGSTGQQRFAPIELVLFALPSAAALEGEPRERRDRAVAIALRAVLGGLTGGARPSVTLLLSTLRAGLAVPELHAPLRQALVEIGGRKDLDLPAEILRELHDLSPSPLHWVRAALAIDREEERRVQDGRAARRSAADWIARGLEGHLPDAPGLQGAILALPTSDGRQLYQLLADLLEPPQVGDVFLALWPAASEAQRKELASFVYDALAIDSGDFFCDECGVVHQYAREVIAADLSARGEPLYQRVAPLLAPRDPRFLTLGLARTAKRSERRALLEAFTSDAAPIDHHVTAIARARELGIAQKPFRERLRARFAGRAEPLARGLELAIDGLGLSSAAARELAEALLDAASSLSASRKASLASQLHLARRIARRSRRGPSGQISLPLRNAES